LVAAGRTDSWRQRRCQTIILWRPAFATHELSAREGKPGDLPGIAYVPGIIAFPGGLPIMTGAMAQIGGIGVSGGTADQDEECAKAGLDAVADDLK
jgi:uncharacterized protein GlcG (DUF336 family)